jgi:hypothetical protein
MKNLDMRVQRKAEPLESSMESRRLHIRKNGCCSVIAPWFSHRLNNVVPRW